MAVISYRRFGTTYRSHLEEFKNPVPFALKLGPIGCPQTPVRNYHYSPRNNPEERKSLLQAVTSLKNFSHHRQNIVISAFLLKPLKTQRICFI
jgi:hypothetical protein